MLDFTTQRIPVPFGAVNQNLVNGSCLLWGRSDGRRTKPIPSQPPRALPPPLRPHRSRSRPGLGPEGVGRRAARSSFTRTAFAPTRRSNYFGGAVPRLKPEYRPWKAASKKSKLGFHFPVAFLKDWLTLPLTSPNGPGHGSPLPQGTMRPPESRLRSSPEPAGS